MRALRLRDEVESDGPGTLDPTVLAGSWINTSESTGLSRLELEARGGELVVRSYGPRGGTPVVWDASVLYAGIASPSPLAFTARSDFGAYQGLLQGNLNLGLLVLGAYKTYPSGRIGYFSREFFAVEPLVSGATVQSETALGDALFGGVEQPGGVELEPILGSWHNADVGSRGIAEIHISENPGGVVVRVVGSGEDGLADWGEAEVGVYACIDEAGARTLSLLASYDFGFMESHLQLRVPGGTLALADFTVFKDGSRRSNYATREFFFRHTGPS